MFGACTYGALSAAYYALTVSLLEILSPQFTFKQSDMYTLPMHEMIRASFTITICF